MWLALNVAKIGCIDKEFLVPDEFGYIGGYIERNLKTALLDTHGHVEIVTATGGTVVKRKNLEEFGMRVQEITAGVGGGR